MTKKAPFYPNYKPVQGSHPKQHFKTAVLSKNKILKNIYVHTYKHPLRPVHSETGIYSNSKLNGTRTTGVK